MSLTVYLNCAIISRLINKNLTEDDYMKSKLDLMGAIFQLVVGILAVLSFVVLWLDGEDMTKWIVTLILSVAFVVLGIIGIVQYKSDK